MPDAQSVVSEPTAPKRQTARPAHRLHARSPARWSPLVVNSAFLLGAVTLPNIATQIDTGPITIRRTASCAPIGPVASRYVDKKKVCRRARKEVLHSLKTGRDPDWDAVIRDSTPNVVNRSRQFPPSKRARQRPKSHNMNPAAPPKASAVTPGARSTNRTQTQPVPGARSLGASATPKPSQHAPAPVPTSRPNPSDRAPWPPPCAAAIALLILLASAAYLGKHRRRVFAVTMSMLRHLKRGPRKRNQTTPSPATDHEAPSATHIASLLAKGASLTGPEAEGVARHMAMEFLRRRRPGSAELVLSRPDAWRLFGMDVGTLREDRIPGLVLTDDCEQTRVFLARQTSPRRLLLAYGTEEDVPRDGGQTTVVSISTRAEGPTKISAGVEVTSTLDPSLASRLPTLTRNDAFNLLMTLPTCARQCED
ncbi:hypothetical protein GCM10009736_70750 [Actinomadura bangladeshensis]